MPTTAASQDPAKAETFARANDDFAAPNGNAPMHTHTQSTLAPTSEYVRYLLLALPARYIPRGIFGTLFETEPYGKAAKAITAPGRWLQNKFPRTTPKNKEAFAYNAIMGVGSLALSASYSHTVYNDIKNIFAEAVALETGKSPNDISRKDLYESDNRIVQKTMDNFWKRSAKRIATDLLFFPAALMRSTGLGDLMVGVKAGQAFGETWKRKTTMFEDLITFINNKINPRNGLGQAINVGEVFDLYQHYTEAFNPEKMFTNVLERGTGEGARWAQSQPIFERMTQLMNLTYAYKHSSKIDPETGRAVQQADFALPKFVYLLGHDLIDVNQPEKTMATIEIANRYGIPAVKEMQKMVAGGASLSQVSERFPTPHIAQQEKQKANGKNGVLPKGSTMQLSALPETTTDAPSTTIDATSAALQSALAPASAALPAHA
jgi:hypothetical protein